jgi:hypothetical protein
MSQPSAETKPIKLIPYLTILFTAGQRQASAKEFHDTMAITGRVRRPLDDVDIVCRASDSAGALGKPKSPVVLVVGCVRKVPRVRRGRSGRDRSSTRSWCRNASTSICNATRERTELRTVSKSETRTDIIREKRIQETHYINDDNKCGIFARHSRIGQFRTDRSGEVETRQHRLC